MYMNKRIIIFACLIVWVYVIIVSVNVGCGCCKRCDCCKKDHSLDSAYSERVISSIREFEYSFFPDQFSGPKKNNYYITTSNEGKYFNIYAWLHVGGMIKRYVKGYDGKKYKYVYFNLEELNRGEIKFYNDPPDEDFNGPDHEFSCSVEELNLQKKIYKPHEDASKSGRWFRIPKLELKEDFNTSQNTLCHLGNFVGRGRNSLSCLLTLIYLKLVLKEQGLDKRLILVFGDREILTYDDDVCFYDDLLYKNCVGNDIKQNIIHKICMEAIKQQLFVFMGTLITNSSEKVGLTHKTLTDVGMQNIFRKLNITKTQNSSYYDYEEDINLGLSTGLTNTNSNTDVFFKNILNFNNGNRLKYQINDHDLNPLLTNSAHDANFLTEEHILFAYDGSSGCFKSNNIDPTKGLSRATIFIVNTNRGFISNNVKCIFYYYRFPGYVQADIKFLSM